MTPKQLWIAVAAAMALVGTDILLNALGAPKSTGVILMLVYLVGFTGQLLLASWMALGLGLRRESLLTLTWAGVFAVAGMTTMDLLVNV